MTLRAALGGPVGYALGSVLRMAALFLLGRLVAQRLGGEGLLAMGQWQNLIGVGVALGGHALQAGLQQGMSTRSDRAGWLGTGLLLGQVLSFAGTATLLALHGLGFVTIPAGMAAAPLLLFVACAAGSLYGNLQACAAGEGRMDRLNPWLAVTGLLQLAWMLPFLGNLASFSVGILTLPLLLGILAWFLLPHPRPHLGRFGEHARAWLPFLSIGLLPGITAQLMQIQIRQLAMGFDLQQAGQWQAGMRLSDTLFPVWTAAATAWILPRLSAGGISPRRALGVSLAGTIPLALGLSLLAPLALDLALGQGFREAAGVLRLQCLTEIVRAASLPLSLLLISKARAGTYVALEVGSNLVQFGLAFAFLPHWGILALPIAAVCENLVYGVVAWRVCKADLRPS